MKLNDGWLDDPHETGRSHDAGRERIVDILEHLYRRERQHLSRYRQHAERIAEAPVRAMLRRIADQEAEHVRWVGEMLGTLGGAIPEVVEFHCAHEPAWDYLRNDLEEERRCLEEIDVDKEAIGTAYPEVVALIDRLARDAKEHREELRRLFAMEQPMSLAA